MVLDRRTQKPLYAAYSQHCTGERRAWNDVERSGNHPVDHVAIGSHANLFEAGSHPVATQCIPPAALQILAASGLPAPVDRSGAGRSFGPASVAGVNPTAVRTVGHRRPAWIRFMGTWGEDQVFHAPPPIGTRPVADLAAVPAVWKMPRRRSRSGPSDEVGMVRVSGQPRAGHPFHGRLRRFRGHVSRGARDDQQAPGSRLRRPRSGRIRLRQLELVVQLGAAGQLQRGGRLLAGQPADPDVRELTVGTDNPAY